VCCPLQLKPHLAAPNPIRNKIHKNKKKEFEAPLSVGVDDSYHHL
jgi:hypothetical protein